MSPSDYKRIKLGRQEARKLITRRVKENAVIFTSHAEARCKERNLIANDVLNVLLSPNAKLLGEGEIERGSFRYTIATMKILVVVSFSSSGDTLFVVTAARRD